MIYSPEIFNYFKHKGMLLETLKGRGELETIFDEVRKDDIEIILKNGVIEYLVKKLSDKSNEITSEGAVLKETRL